MAEKQNRPYKKRRYVAAFFITLLIFILGNLVGIVIESKRVNVIEQKSQLQRLDYESLQVQYLYMNQLIQERDCDAMSKAFESNVRSLEDARLKLETYEQDSLLYKQDFEVLRRNYVLAQIRYFLLAKQTKELCKKDIVSVLYFFSSKEECPDCEEQAFVLTYFKKLLKDNILIFSFDGRMEDEPMILLLKERYNVTSYPTIVVEGVRYEGLFNKNKLQKELCKQYTNNTILDCQNP
ncbi:MAG: hypothetical protein V1743_00750 [Nanoarchaeota archaeon]